MFGLTIVCNGDNVRCIRCIDSQCDIVTTGGNFDESESHFDEMIDVIDGILNVYDTNYGISPKKYLEFKDWLNNTDGYCTNTKSLYTSTLQSTNNKTFSNNICCLAHRVCSNMIAIGEKSQQNNFELLTYPNLYCGAAGACSGASVSNLRNVYGSATKALHSANITNFSGMVICSAKQSCYSSTIRHGNVVACFAVKSCYKAMIDNVTMVIGLGPRAISSTTLRNVQTVIVLGGDAAYQNVTLSNIPDDCSVYCQIDICDYIFSIHTPEFYCYSVTDISIVNNFMGKNLTNIQHCLTTQQPTTFPTSAPSLAPTAPPCHSSRQAFADFVSLSLLIVTILLGLMSLIAGLNVFCIGGSQWDYRNVTGMFGFLVICFRFVFEFLFLFGFCIVYLWLRALCYSVTGNIDSLELSVICVWIISTTLMLISMILNGLLIRRKIRKWKKIQNDPNTYMRLAITMTKWQFQEKQING